METTTNSRTPLWIFISIVSLPLVYLVFVWNSLPASVPLHFDITGKPDDYGSPYELLGVLLVMSIIGVGMAWLMTNLHRIDPKKSMGRSSSTMQKMSFLIVFLLTAIMFYVIYTVSGHEALIESRFILMVIALFLSYLGNLMNNIKPNYFVGIRTPWTLENGAVWRATHHFASRLWFFGGMLEALLILLVPQTAGVIVFIAGTAILAITPIIYSYRIYRELKK